MSPDRTAIAAGTALLGLGALTGAAVTSGGETSQPAAATGPVEVRTQVIHQTAPSASTRGRDPSGASRGPAAISTRQSGWDEGAGGETEHGDDDGGRSRATRGGGQDD